MRQSLPWSACSWVWRRWPWALSTPFNLPRAAHTDASAVALATIFAAVSGSTLGVLSVFRAIGMSKTTEFSHVAVIGLAEALVPIFFGFGCLTAAWLCVAMGLWRRP